MKENNNYKSFRISLHVQHQIQAIAILESISPYFRNRYIADAVVAYSKTNGLPSSSAGDKKLTVDQKIMPKGNISKEGEFFW